MIRSKERTRAERDGSSDDNILTATTMARIEGYERSRVIEYGGLYPFTAVLRQWRMNPVAQRNFGLKSFSLLLPVQGSMVNLSGQIQEE